MSIGQSPRSTVRTLVGAALVVGGLLPLAGCNTRYPEAMHYGLRKDLLVKGDTSKTPPTRLDTPGQLHEWVASLAPYGIETFSPAKLSGKENGELEQTLEKTFGTPAHPKVEGLDAAVVEQLQLQPATLTEGSELFRRHCLHCHGVTGNGQGPTAPWVNPHPRDYRRGIFKFTASKQPFGVARKPRREDLVRTVTQGIEGTSMPAFGAQSNSKFGVLPEDQIRKLVSYVIHLSLRGEVEFDTMWYHDDLQDENGQPASIAEFAAERLTTFAGRWRQAETDVIQPGKYAVPEGDPAQMQASIARGYKLFLDPSAGCIKCHTDFGRRNNFLFDAWGTVVRPRNLTEGIFRGGRRPIDVYWRIHGGINGANMPDASGALQPDQIWDVVNFVEALPYPGMLPKDVKEQVYPSGEESPRELTRGGQPAAFLPAHPATRPEAQE